jgi:hypothetical protein
MAKERFVIGDRVVLPPWGKEFPKTWKDVGIKQGNPGTVKSVDAKKDIAMVLFDGDEREELVLQLNLRKMTKAEIAEYEKKGKIAS